MTPPTSTSMAPTAVLLPPRSTVVASRLPASPYLPPRTLSSSSVILRTEELIPRSIIDGVKSFHSLAAENGGSAENLRIISWRVRNKLFSWKSSPLRIRSSSTEDSPTLDANELLTDLKQKWDAVENKSTVLLYGGGAIVAVWLSSVLVGAINSVPLLPKIMELVGLGYTGWFVYKYLLFKSSRKELAEDIEGLKKKISGFE